VTETVSTLEIRQRLGDLLNRVALRHDRFVIERKGKPFAALVPVARLEQMQQAARHFLLESMKERKGAVPARDADRLADEAKHKTRRRARRP
jgi:prevent-host-death family protein